MKNSPVIKSFGDRAFLLEWKSTIDPTINEYVLKAEKTLLKYCRKEIIETVSSYHSLAIYLKQNVESREFKNKIKKCLEIYEPEEKGTTFLNDIPVCYATEFGMDLQHLAALHKLTPKEIIKIHTQPVYRIYFLGFLPGFPYLGGLDKKLHTPRKSAPRTLIEKGSVGIGGNQTGIYTVNSPGGWNIIGKSPLQFFNSNTTPFSLLSAGDYIKFSAITKEAYYEMEEQVRLGKYKLHKEIYSD